MGLSVSHGCWDGPYSAFHRWRTAVARAVGIPFNLMEGIYDEGGFSSMSARLRQGDADPGVLAELPIKWDILRPDPLHILLTHSDCDGVIAAADCLPLAQRLKEISSLLDYDPLRPDSSDRGRALQFAAGLREAAAANDDVEFM